MSHETFTASAPGKLMILGEHAVVYGHPCIVTAVNRRVRVSVAASDDARVVIHAPTLSKPFDESVKGFVKRSAFPAPVRFVAHAVLTFWEYTGATCGIEVATRSEFTHSYGLGSSSAVTVATIQALAAAAGHDLDVEQIFQLSYQAALTAQGGVGSGFDVAAATFGGTLYFGDGQVIAALPVTQLPLVVGYSGRKASSAEYVQRVAAYRRAHPGLVDAVIEDISALAWEARPLLNKGHWQRLGSLMDQSQERLQTLGVSTPELDTLVQAARRSGAYGAKLSGAGGGDCMIALVAQENRQQVEQAIEQAGVPGAEVLQVETGAPGVVLEDS